MKILHTADWHLGQTFYEYDRREEHLHFLEWLKQQIRQHEIDVLLIAGDVFDSPNPSAESQRMYYRFLREVTSENPSLQIIIIAGNHDSAARLEAPNPLLEDMNVTVRGVVRRNAEGDIDLQHLIVPLYTEGEVTAYCLAVPYLRQGDYPSAENYSKGVQLLYEQLFNEVTKPMEPTKHQYDVDTETVVGFLKTHGLDKDFKVNIEVNHATLAGHTFEHELAVAVDNGMLGSIDANRGDYQNGWDTDQFPIDNYELTQAMMQIIRNGGLGNGGTNFDAKTRRNSTDLEDIFIAHIAGMDAMARALESAAALLNESPYCKMLSDRYASFDSGKGKEFEEGKLTLEDVVAYAKQNGEPKQVSGKQELYEAIVNMYC